MSQSQADIEASYLEEEKKEEEEECKNAVENIRFPEEGGERERERDGAKVGEPLKAFGT